MEQNDIIGKVNEVMQKGFEIEASALKPEAHLFTDLGLDSLDAIDMLVHLEEKIGMKVEADRFQTVRTLGDVYNLVGELSRSQASDGVTPPPSHGNA